MERQSPSVGDDNLKLTYGAEEWKKQVTPYNRNFSNLYTMEERGEENIL